MLEDIKNIKSGTKELREFGLTIGAILVILGGVALWRGKVAYPYLLGTGGLLAAAGVTAPIILKPIQKAWMALAVVIGFFASRLILVILFYAVLTPIGLVMKMFGKDILDERIDKNKTSYWVDRIVKEKNKESYENQY